MAEAEEEWKGCHSSMIFKKQQKAKELFSWQDTATYTVGFSHTEAARSLSRLQGQWNAGEFEAPNPQDIKDISSLFTANNKIKATTLTHPIKSKPKWLLCM